MARERSNLANVDLVVGISSSPALYDAMHINRDYKIKIRAILGNDLESNGRRYLYLSEPLQKNRNRLETKFDYLLVRCSF